MSSPFRRLDLNLLRVLVALDRTRSVTAAGHALALSQPAASNALGRLRRHFDDALFQRTPGALAPTPLGAALAAAAARHLESLERELQAPLAFEPATSTLTWRLSLSDLGEMVFLPAIADAVLREAPGTRIVNAAVAAQEVGDALARREIDLAIGILGARSRGARSELLFRERYVALAQGRGGARRRALPESLGLVVASPTATFHEAIEKSLVRAGLGERIALRTRHFAAMPDVVLAAPLAAVVPSTWAAMVVARRPELAVYALPPGLPDFEVRLLWHATSEGDAAVDWLRARVVALFRRGRA